MEKTKEPPSPSNLLEVEKRDSTVLITLNRPEKLNALNRPLREALSATLTELASDDSARAVILTGKGRAFSAGMDLNEFPKDNDSNGSEGEGKHLSVYKVLDAFPKPVIAAVNGFAITGGFELVLSCDIILATRGTRFGDTHAPLGVMPGAGLSQKLSRIIGLPRAMFYSMTGEYISAEEAFRIGLVSHLLSSDKLIETAWEIGGKLASLDPIMAVRMKALLRDGSRTTMADGLAMEQEAHKLWSAEGRRKGVEKTREKVMKNSREHL